MSTSPTGCLVLATLRGSSGASQGQPSVRAGRSACLTLRPRELLPQPGGFEGFGSFLEHTEASDLPVLDCEHERASRDHLDPLAPPNVGGVRDDNFGANLREAVHLNLDVLKGRPERIPEDLKLVIAIDPLERPSGTRPVNFRIGAKKGQPHRQLSPVPGFVIAPHSFNVLLRHRPSSESHEIPGRSRCYSASVSPEPPSSSGKSLSLGRPSFMRSTVDS